MHILSLNYEFPPLGGGGGYVTKAINESLVNKGFKVDLVTMHFRGLEHEEMINGVKVYRVKSIRKKQETCEIPEMASYVISAIPFIRKLIKKNHYDIIHCHFAIPTGIVAYFINKLDGLDYIITAHGSDVPGYNPDRFQLAHKFTAPLIRSVMKKAKAVITPSAFLKDLIEHNVDSKLPINIIPNGIASDMFSINEQRNNWILMSGRLLSRKGFQYVLEAVKDSDLPDWEIHLAGDGPHRKELEALAEDLPNKVVFHGWLKKDRAELKSLYEHSKIFILPSDVENASIALLEAMSAELAIITTNTTGCQEMVGNAALLTSPHDVDGIKKALLELTQNNSTREELGKKGRQLCLERFSWDRIVEAYTKIYESDS